MCMLQQFLAAPKKQRQVILILDLVRVNYMSSLLFLLHNAILGVGPGSLDLTHCKGRNLKFMNYTS